MKINKIMLLSPIIITPVITMIACSSTPEANITVSNPVVNSKTKENTTIEITIKNLAKTTTASEVVLYLGEQEQQSQTSSTPASKIENEVVTFSFNNLKEGTTYKLLRVEYKDQAANVVNSTFTVEGVKKNKDPINSPEDDPYAEIPPKVIPEPPKNPIKPVEPPKDQPVEEKVFSVNIKAEASNKYASEFLLNESSLILNKEYFDITNTKGIADKDINIVATSFDDVTGEMSLKISGGGKENNISFLLNANLNLAKNNPYLIYLSKNKTNEFQISATKTDAERASAIKNGFGGSHDSNKINFLKTLLDYKILNGENDFRPYPHVELEFLRDMAVDETTRENLIPMQASFTYTTWLSIRSLKKGNTKITISSSDNFYQNIGQKRQTFKFPVTKINKAIFDSIEVNQTFKNSIKSLFPSYLYALSQDLAQQESARVIDVAQSEDNYANYNTTNAKTQAKSITNATTYKQAINSLLTSKYITNVVEWLLSKEIEIIHAIGDSAYSDIEGEFTLSLKAVVDSELGTSAKGYFKDLKVSGFEKFDKTKQMGEGIIGYHVRFNDDPGKNSDKTIGLNWNSFIKIGGATSIAKQIETLDAGTKTGWQSVAVSNNALDTLNSTTNNRRMLQLKYNDLLMNLYGMEKWPFPIDITNDYRIEITSLEYDKDTKKIRFGYIFKLGVKDNNDTTQFSKTGISTATLVKEVSGTTTTWKITNVSHDELRKPLSS